MRHELETRGVHAQHTGPSQPPALGHGPSNLFGGIMANQGGSGPGLVPPLPQDQHTLPAAAVTSGAPQLPQTSYAGYQPGAAAVNGMCDCV